MTAGCVVRADLAPHEYSGAEGRIVIPNSGSRTPLSGHVLLFAHTADRIRTHHMDHTAILEKIKGLRKERGYSHEKMAELLHMSPSAYQRHEADHTKLDLDWLQAVAKVLEVDLIDLLRGGSVVVNMHDQKGGVASGYNNVVHHNDDLAELLKTINEHHAELLREQREFNARQMLVLERMISIVHRVTSSTDAR